jgi:hypothetical protein
MESRWKKHVYAAKSSKGGRWHFPNAIRKYGAAAFSHDVLAICDTLEEANQIEREKIEEFKTRDPRLGFNLAEGGGFKPHPIRKNPWDDPAYRAHQMTIDRSHLQTPEVRVINRAAHNTPESKARQAAASRRTLSRSDTINKISQAAKERAYTPEIRQNMSRAAKCRKPSMRNNSGWPVSARERAAQANRSRVWTDEMCAKISAANLGKQLSDDHKTKIAAARIERERTIRREHHLQRARSVLANLLRFITVDDIQTALLELKA